MTYSKTKFHDFSVENSGQSFRVHWNSLYRKWTWFQVHGIGLKTSNQGLFATAAEAVRDAEKSLRTDAK